MTDKRPKIILLGGGGHCRSCIDVIEKSNMFRIGGIVEQQDGVIGDSILGYPIIGNDNELPLIRKDFDHALVAVGQIQSSKTRKKLFSILKNLEFKIPVIISPLSYISKHSVIDEGTIVMHHAIVSAGAQIGKNCILNSKCLIEHDVVIGDHTHISTAAVVNGASAIGSNCFIGSNAVAINGVKLPTNSFCKAGSLIK